MAYRQALVKMDLPALVQIWTDDYTFIDAHGHVLTKADRLADLRSSATSLDKIRNEEKPRYGGKEVSGPFRSTHIWILSGGHWLMMTS